MIYCLIPAKPHAEAKTRLAPVLTGSQRADLSRWLLRRTVRLARQVIGPVVVVSRDPDILAQAETQGAWGLPEASTGLNLALTQAAHFARDQGATALLVLPSDLPRLTASDLECILSLGGLENPCWKPVPHSAGSKPALQATRLLVIAPCRRGTGTNALLMRPPDLIPFRFGPDSLAAHCAAARTAGVEPLIYRSDNIAFDLDTPEDWELGIGNQRMLK
jgi:2-phospho-L-lactate guanylyltransferase (CobY/MobA/RfbA family)